MDDIQEASGCAFHVVLEREAEDCLNNVTCIVNSDAIYPTVSWLDLKGTAKPSRECVVQFSVRPLAAAHFVRPRSTAS